MLCLADSSKEEKPIRPLVDDWIKTNDQAGLALKMYPSGTVVVEHKVYDPETRKYRVVSKLVLPWEAFEHLRASYKRYKALRDREGVHVNEPR